MKMLAMINIPIIANFLCLFHVKYLLKADIAEKGPGRTPEKLKINHSQETLQKSVDLNRVFVFDIFRQ